MVLVERNYKGEVVTFLVNDNTKKEDLDKFNASLKKPVVKQAKKSESKK